MIEVNNKDYSISILRVIGMISIVLCHFFGWLKINALAQFLNYGVYLFLFISGYLYANKQIDNYKQWIVTRLKKDSYSILHYHDTYIVLILLQ